MCSPDVKTTSLFLVFMLKADDFSLYSMSAFLRYSSGLKDHFEESPTASAFVIKVLSYGIEASLQIKVI